VGITRAEERLYLVYAQNRSSFGYSEPVDPSRFLADVPQHMLEDTQRSRSARQTPAAQSWSSPAPSRWNQKATSSQSQGPRFKAGMRVQHPVWGEGMVLNSRFQDEDEIVDIFFENMGLKRVSASLAKLEPK
jgi:DNA helicase-2/ATP-dependent DNA helicase PcrA